MNNETKHTPGPWLLDGQYVQKDADGGIIARVHGSNAECKANARLIAAAPETAAERDRLREALRQIQNNAAARKWNSESVDRADLDAWTAIESKAKAALTGSPDPSPTQRVRDAAPELFEALKECLAVVQVQNGNLHADTNAIQDKARAAIAKAEQA
jgi:hypothetical protein